LANRQTFRWSDDTLNSQHSIGLAAGPGVGHHGCRRRTLGDQIRNERLTLSSSAEHSQDNHCAERHDQNSQQACSEL
jgi:hypothetical protein